MKQRSSPLRLLRACVAAVVFALGIGCGDERTDPGEPSPEPVATVTLSIENDTMLVASALHLDATPRDSEGNPLEGRDVAWSTSDPALATVLAGDVHARALGVVTITAASEGESASATITLAPLVTVSRRLPTTFAGDTTLLTAALSDVEGGLLAGGVDEWSSSDESVASVSADGIVTGVSAGTATIRASVSGGNGSVELVVLEPRLRPNREISYRLAGSQNLRRIGAEGDGDIELTDPAHVVNGYDWSPSGDRLAVSYRGDGGEKSGLYTMNADGSDERELVPDAGQNPRWSPDGSRILLIRGSPAELYVIGGDGTALAPLTQTGVDYWNHEWSPDGRRFGVHRSDCREFWLLDFPGGNQQRVPLPTPACEHRWSPDGKLIAYYSVTTATSGIWLLNSDGSNPRPLTPNCTPAGACGGDRNYYRPRWSPDGRRLAYVSESMGASGMVHIFDLDQRATREFILVGEFLDYTVEWSPDGTRLAFSGRHANGRGAVVVSGVDGSGQVPLTEDGVDSEVPVWRR